MIGRLWLKASFGVGWCIWCWKCSHFWLRADHLKLKLPHHHFNQVKIQPQLWFGGVQQNLVPMITLVLIVSCMFFSRWFKGVIYKNCMWVLITCRISYDAILMEKLSQESDRGWYNCKVVLLNREPEHHVSDLKSNANSLIVMKIVINLW